MYRGSYLQAEPTSPEFDLFLYAKAQRINQEALDLLARLQRLRNVTARQVHVVYVGREDQIITPMLINQEGKMLCGLDEIRDYVEQATTS